MMDFYRLIRGGIFLIACFSVLPPECMTATISPGGNSTECLYSARKPCDAPRYCDQDAMYPDPDDCNAFFRCDNSRYTEENCAGITCWDLVTGACMDCAIATCQGPCTPTGPTTAPINDTGPCPAHIDLCKEIGNTTSYLFPDTNDCEIYYTCYDGFLDYRNPKTCITFPTCFVFNFKQQTCIQKTVDTDCERQCPEVPTTAATEATAITDSSTATPTPPPVSGFSGGAIAGIVFVTLALIAILIIIILILVKKCSSPTNEVSDKPDEHSTPMEEGNPPPPGSQLDMAPVEPDEHSTPLDEGNPPPPGSQPDMTPVST